MSHELLNSESNHSMQSSEPSLSKHFRYIYIEI